MRASRSARLRKAGLALIGLLCLAWPVSRNLATVRGERTIRSKIWGAPHVPGKKVLRLLALGHEEFLADLFWLRAIQYYGDEGNRKIFYVDLHRFIDAANALDPGFYQPYVFGGTVVPYHRGGGHWVNVEASNAILERGLKRYPMSVPLWMQLGFNDSIALEEYGRAARAYLRAATCPGAPSWLTLLATRLFSADGQIEAAERFLIDRARSEKDPKTREKLSRRLAELRAEKRRRRLEARVRVFRERTGRLPENLDELRQSDPIARDLLAREETSYHLGEDGSVTSDAIRGGRLTVYR